MSMLADNAIGTHVMSKVASASRGYSTAGPAAGINGIGSLTLDQDFADDHPGRQFGRQQYSNSHHRHQQQADPLAISSRSLEPQRDGSYMTVYERATYELTHDKRSARDVAIGKQIGFYRLREEIGSGNFSQVKLGVHMLTKGS